MVTRRTTTVPITLDAKNDEQDEYDALAVEERRLGLEQARRASNKRAPITRKLNEVRARMDELKESIESGRITVTVTALPSSKYRNLLKDHPPREGDEFDQKVGYNEDSFILPFLTAATVAARDADGADVPLDVEKWLDEDDGLDPVDTLSWFRAALGLQTGRQSRGPRLRAS